MGMEVCEREQDIPEEHREEEESRDFPTRLTCDIGVIVLELEFESWSRSDGFAIYRDTNSHREEVKVFNNDGTLVADIRED